MKLPEKENTIQSKIDNQIESQEEDQRFHLGLSIIGGPCDRKIWLSFRWAMPQNFSGRMLRLFRRGHREELSMIADLESIGLKVHSIQKRIEFGCHVSGSIDGIVDGITEEPHLLEMKTHNDKSFKELKEKGVEKAKPEHLIQMQCYMYGLDLTRALYFAVNKNDDEYYTERIHADFSPALWAVARGKNIATSDQIPPPLSDNPSWYQCKMCQYYDWCFDNFNADPIREHCRTCEHCGIREKIVCKKWRGMAIPEDHQLKGCQEYKRHYDLRRKNVRA